MLDKLDVLGHIIHNGKILPTPEKIRHITDFKPPTCKMQLQQFLGSVNYIGGHLPHLATIEAPLTELTGETAWRWDAWQQRSFEQIKDLCRVHVPLAPINYRNMQADTPAGSTPTRIY